MAFTLSTKTLTIVNNKYQDYDCQALSGKGKKVSPMAYIYRGFSLYANFITANFITAIFQKNP